jgi:hypothetical protein
MAASSFFASNRRWGKYELATTLAIFDEVAVPVLIFGGILRYDP